MRVVLVGETDAVCLSGEAELPGVAREGRQPAGRRNLDSRVEILRPKELFPRLLGVHSLGNHLDAFPASLGKQHAHGFAEVRPLKHGAFVELSDDLFCLHRCPPLRRYQRYRYRLRMPILLLTRADRLTIVRPSPI